MQVCHYSKHMMNWCAGRALQAHLRGDAVRLVFWEAMATFYFNDSRMLGGDNFAALQAMAERRHSGATTH